MLKAERSDATAEPDVLPVVDKHVDAVLPHVSPQIRAMVELQRFTGMRPGEVTIMRPCDIDRASELPPPLELIHLK